MFLLIMYEHLYEKEFWFSPRREELEDILVNTEPRGKRVLAVASYGYPLAFLAEGASFVASFDVDPKKVAWNLFLRTMIQKCEYDEALRFMQQRANQEFICSIAEEVPEEYRTFAVLLAEKYLGIEETDNKIRCEMIPEEKKLFNVYPFVRDSKTYQQVKEAIKKGCWTIEEAEFLQFVEREASNNKTYDVVYASTLRSWMNIHIENEQNFRDKYDIPLSNAIDIILTENGVFYEAIIPPENFGGALSPLQPFSNEIYPFLDVVLCTSNTDLLAQPYIGTKIAT